MVAARFHELCQGLVGAASPGRGVFRSSAQNMDLGESIDTAGKVRFGVHIVSM